jgi:hypothetical protein
MQNQAILAGLRALVEQIDLLERRNAASYAAPAQMSHALVDSRVGTFLPVPQSGQRPRAYTVPVQSRAVSIAQRLGVSSHNFFQVAHAVRRESCLAG